MNASPAADLPVVNYKERGAEIERRRLRMGIASLTKFADATGFDRNALAKAERGEGSERTYRRAEAWLDDHEEQMGMGDPEPQAPHSPDPTAVSITMSGVHGIKDVVISGPIDHLEELKKLAVDLLREVRGED